MQDPGCLNDREIFCYFVWGITNNSFFTLSFLRKYLAYVGKSHQSKMQIIFDTCCISDISIFMF